MLVEKSLLWGLVLVGLCLFIYSLRKPPIKEWLLFFFLTGYLSSIIGVFVVEEKLLSYPVNLFNRHFDSSLTYEYILFPVLGIYYYQSTYNMNWVSWLWKSVVFSGIITLIEFFLERYTDLIHYEKWTWGYTFVSTCLVLFTIRLVMNYLSKVKDQ
ncbi:MAG: CBO0543 family protein [Anaerobacillus sp.]